MTPFKFSSHSVKRTGPYVEPQHSVPNTICATVYEQGCIEEFCLNMTTEPNNPLSSRAFCATQFTSTEEFVFVPGDTLQNETVLIEYTDESGVIFSSEITPQAQDAFFIIEDFEPFDANEKGNPTIKMEIDFSCKLASADGEVLKINSAFGIFAVEE